MKTVILSGLLSLLVMLSISSSFNLGRRGLWGGRANLTKRLQSTLAQAAASNKAVVNHPSYDRLEDFSMPEYGLSGTIYAHRKSGAQVISVIAPDENKVFGITFRTPPKDR